VETLTVYSDAKLPGGTYGVATAACVGWTGEEKVIEVTTPLGRCGINEAEYRGVIEGLQRARDRVSQCPSITHVLIVSDSEPVINTLTLRKDARKLRSLRAQARVIQGEVEHAGVAVNYEWASRSSTKIKVAHALAANAHAQRAGSES
jgi:ribonuclease HI